MVKTGRDRVMKKLTSSSLSRFKMSVERGFRILEYLLRLEKRLRPALSEYTLGASQNRAERFTLGEGPEGHKFEWEMGGADEHTAIQWFRESNAIGLGASEATEKRAERFTLGAWEGQTHHSGKRLRVTTATAIVASPSGAWPWRAPRSTSDLLSLTVGVGVKPVVTLCHN
ncbi:hypothetical protein C8R44DRAFT_742920 [Mycena epipterygia]|nr:hypothetical protein C8R44DRAFT_742920 [Mycena epipterygia]